MTIRELKPDEKERWDEFVIKHPHSQLVHLYYYQFFLKIPYSIKKFVYFVAKDDDKIVGILPCYIKHKKIVCYGEPLVQGDDTNICSEFMKTLDNYVKKHHLFGSVILPSGFKIPNKQMKWLESFGHEAHTSKTVILSLEPLLEELWKNINKKNRNAIRKAKKKNVKVVKATKKEDMEDYYKLHKTLWNYKKLEHEKPLSYWFELWDIFKQKYNCADMYLAVCDGKKVAGVIVYKFNKMALYAHGASLQEYRKYAPSNLIHWTIISDLKKEGFDSYELGDIGPDSPESTGKRYCTF